MAAPHWARYQNEVITRQGGRHNNVCAALGAALILGLNLTGYHSQTHPEPPEHTKTNLDTILPPLRRGSILIKRFLMCCWGSGWVGTAPGQVQTQNQCCAQRGAHCCPRPGLSVFLTISAAVLPRLGSGVADCARTCPTVSYRDLPAVPVLAGVPTDATAGHSR